MVLLLTQRFRSSVKEHLVILFTVLLMKTKFYLLSNASTSKISLGNQASGGVISDTKGLNKITLPFGRELTNEEKAAGYTNSKLIAVPHFPYATSKFGFLLTSGDKQPLVEACVQEFDSTLNGRAINYPSAKLSNQSNYPSFNPRCFVMV